MSKKGFNFGASPVAKMAEEIRNEENTTAGQPELPASTTNVEQPQEVQTLTEHVKTDSNNTAVAPVAKEEQHVVVSQPLQAVKAKKKKNGIVIDVPIEDYLALVSMKVMTGKTLKDLALQAVHEFVERNKM